jgi:hypothetical protein
MLLRRTGRHHEPFVTTRPTARPPGKIRRGYSWALALAVLHDASWSCFGNDTNRLLLPWLAFAVASTLRASSFLALGAGSVVLTGPLAPPPPGCLLASGTAVATLWLTRPEPLLTAFQKAAAAAKPSPRPLNARASSWILRWAHGRLHSRRSSLGGEWRLCSGAFSLYPITPP